MSACDNLNTVFNLFTLLQEGFTALHIACARDDYEVVDALLQDVRVDVNMPQKVPIIYLFYLFPTMNNIRMGRQF